MSIWSTLHTLPAHTYMGSADTNHGPVIEEAIDLASAVGFNDLLRLSIVEDPDPGAVVAADLALSREQATALRDALTEWIDNPPTPEEIEEARP